MNECQSVNEYAEACGTLRKILKVDNQSQQATKLLYSYQESLLVPLLAELRESLRRN